MKRLITFFLSAALLLSPVLAVGTSEKFPAVNSYPGYADVKEGDWFYDNAKLCYEIGLMTGTDKGFEPGKVLTVAECSTIAARMREALTGEIIPEADPTKYVFCPLPWWVKYVDYIRDADPTLAATLAHPEEECSRGQFLSLLNAAIPAEADVLTVINSITTLPDEDSQVVLKFYNAGILTGVDALGTFAGERSLTRAEAAAMVSRVARPELRLSFTPADYSPFTAAYLTPDTVMFENGTRAEEFLITVNNAISAWEAALGEDFNWHYVWTDGKSVLTHVKEDSLSALGVTEKQGTEAYRDFDVQVYYSRLIDLTGETL